MSVAERVETPISHAELERRWAAVRKEMAGHLKELGVPAGKP